MQYKRYQGTLKILRGRFPFDDKNTLSQPNTRLHKFYQWATTARQLALPIYRLMTRGFKLKRLQNLLARVPKQFKVAFPTVSLNDNKILECGQSNLKEAMATKAFAKKILSKDKKNPLSRVFFQEVIQFLLFSSSLILAAFSQSSLSNASLSIVFN